MNICHQWKISLNDKSESFFSGYVYSTTPFSQKNDDFWRLQIKSQNPQKLVKIRLHGFWHHRTKPPATRQEVSANFLRFFAKDTIHAEIRPKCPLVACSQKGIFGIRPIRRQQWPSEPVRKVHGKSNFLECSSYIYSSLLFTTQIFLRGISSLISLSIRS